jgi:hypothetical protein
MHRYRILILRESGIVNTYIGSVGKVEDCAYEELGVLVVCWTSLLAFELHYAQGLEAGKSYAGA